LDPTEVDRLYRRYFPAIRAKCRRMLAAEAEAQDVAQETFVRLWRSGLDGRKPPQILAWIYRTSTRLAVDRLRQHQARPAASLEDVDGEREQPSHEPGLLARQELGQLARRLGRDDLELVVMSRLDRMTHAEIALVLGTSDRTVRRRLVRLDQTLTRFTTEQRHGA
jgi:RNA polymerase sigma-70 factor (ECF subfamily)